VPQTASGVLPLVLGLALVVLNKPLGRAVVASWERRFPVYQRGPRSVLACRAFLVVLGLGVAVVGLLLVLGVAQPAGVR
jgi:hypothetical protein